MTMSVEQFLDTSAFMKPSVIHNDHAFSLETWNKCELTPVIKYIAIDILFKVIKRKQHLVIKSTDDVSSLFCLPVVAVDTGCTNRCIAMRADGLVLKAAFIHIDNGIALLRKAIKFTLISHSFYQAGFWML